MNKLISLVKVSLNHDMNIFKINSKKQNKFTKFGLPLFFTLSIMFLFGIYANELIKLLKPVHLEFVVLTLFAFFITILTFIEGVYKSGSLLFNCKDDQLLFSLPIKKSTVLFIRIFKLYCFEFLYNSLFLLAPIIIYAYYVQPSWTYYLASLIALILLPIVPIVLSCIVGFIITFLSSKFKGKNIMQTIITSVFLLLIIYFSYNLDNFMNSIASKASDINEFLTKLYYPIGAYISLVTSFDIKTLIIFIISHLLILLITIIVLGKIFFKINSNYKRVLTSKKNKRYIIKRHSKAFSFIKKELNRFVSTPVFITNAGFGLVLFIVACFVGAIKFDSLINIVVESIPGISNELVINQLPVIMFGLVCFASLMTSITSSMISLENKTFSLLKSLPIKSSKIVLYKIIASLVIMIPCILIGDLIFFIRFKFDLLSILLILIASFLLPFVSELIGIIVNLKYPKLDASNDTEIVKQSMSSMISVFIGLGLVGVTAIILFKMLDMGISGHLIMLLFIIVYGIMCLGLWLYLVKTSDRSFNNIEI